MAAPAPPSTQTCLGRIDAKGPMLFTVLVKRTYGLAAGQPLAADEPEPIVEEAEYSRNEDTGALVARRLSEVVPDRRGCDLVVLATARAVRPVQRRLVGIEAPGIRRYLVASGDRRVCNARGSGVVFTPPDPWESMPLSWDRAYGGIDFGVFPQRDWPKEDILRALEIPPGAYPRNDVGRGYAVAGSSFPLADRLLPNIEDPDDLLAPERLVCPKLACWHLQPGPAAFGFYEGHWFPRSIHAGVIAGRWPDLSAGPVREEASGLLPAGLLAHQRDNLQDLVLSPGYFSNAAPGMVLPRAEGTERLVLHGLDSDDSRLTIDLPGEPPAVSVQVAGRRAEIGPPRMHQILVDLNEDRLTMLWGASMLLDDPVLAGLTDDELAGLPVAAV